ncbi:MAG: hypothetical protein M3Z85_05655 [Acidobacteriota bacterium]|nr:hypothetical protein [Acidobacteriota bacterium]
MNDNAYVMAPDLSGDLRGWQSKSLIVGVIGLLLCIVGFVLDRQQFFRSYLIGFFFWMGMGLGCMGLLMMHHLSGGAWGMVIRRPLESGTRGVYLMIPLFLPLVLGMGTLYSWTRPDAAHDAVLQAKSFYLNQPFFFARIVFYFLIWGVMVFLLNKWSIDQDRGGPMPWANKLESFSGPGLVVYALTITFASVDLLMSLDPHWFSTVYGLLVMIGQGLSALAFMIAVIVLLATRPPLSNVITRRHLHDLGKLLLAFVMLWAYLSFSQLIIIWSGNLPEEIPWYVNRFNGGWLYVGWVLLLFHFVLPFLMLLSQRLKKNPKKLLFVAVWVIIIRLVDVFWLVEPNFDKGALRLHWMDLAAPIGIGGVWIWWFLRQLQQQPLLPVNAPDLQKVLDHGRHH